MPARKKDQPSKEKVRRAEWLKRIRRQSVLLAKLAARVRAAETDLSRIETAHDDRNPEFREHWEFLESMYEEGMEAFRDDVTGYGEMLQEQKRMWEEVIASNGSSRARRSIETQLRTIAGSIALHLESRVKELEEFAFLLHDHESLLRQIERGESEG